MIYYVWPKSNLYIILYSFYFLLSIVLLGLGKGWQGQISLFTNIIVRTLHEVPNMVKSDLYSDKGGGRRRCEVLGLLIILISDDLSRLFNLLEKHVLCSEFH